MATEIQQISKKLDVIKSDLEYIKKRMINVDSILTEDDIEALEEAEKDLKDKKTKRL